MADKVEAPKEEQVTLVLNTSFVTNGVTHGPGKVTVPSSLADDLVRRQEYWDRVEKFRLESKDYTVKEALASFDAAGK